MFCCMDLLAAGKRDLNTEFLFVGDRCLCGCLLVFLGSRPPHLVMVVSDEGGMGSELMPFTQQGSGFALRD